MSKMKEIDIDKKNYISQNFGTLICRLAYESARDELKKDGKIMFETELLSPFDSTKFTLEFQELLNKHVEYYESKFYEFIKVPVISIPEFIAESTILTEIWNNHYKNLK